MSRLSGSATLDRVLNNLGEAITPETAARILALEPDPEVEERLDYLSERSTEGLLTEEERAEYEGVVFMGDFVMLMKRQAKAVLSQHSQK
jgi:hypothetical protein